MSINKLNKTFVHVFAVVDGNSNIIDEVNKFINVDCITSFEFLYNDEDVVECVKITVNCFNDTFVSDDCSYFCDLIGLEG